MKAEYDFSKVNTASSIGQDAALNLPLYLDPDVDAFMRQLAGKTGKDVQKIVNEWLRSNIKLVESAQ